MTAGEAIKMADELRPNNSFSDEMKQLWLRQADSGLRRNVVERSDTGSDFEGVCGVGEEKVYAGGRREADDVNERALERGRTSPSRLTACHLPYRGEALAGRATLNWMPEV